MVDVNDIARMSYNEVVAFVEDVNRHWPNPVSASGETRGQGYCVGGAFVRACGDSGIGFPGNGYLDIRLRMANPRLKPSPFIGADTSSQFASRIITLNDRGDFDEARAELLRALLYGREPVLFAP